MGYPVDILTISSSYIPVLRMEIQLYFDCLIND